MNRKLVALIWLALSVGSLPALAQLQFTIFPTPLPATAKLYAVAYDGSHFVAVGSNNVFVTLTLNAGQPPSPNNGSLGGILIADAVASGAGQFVVSGSSNLVSTTSDPENISWSTPRRAFAGNTARGTGLTWNNNNFVLALAAPEIAFSSDLTSWTAASLTSASFLESFRAAASLGADGGFAV